MKKQSGNFSEMAAIYGFTYDKRDRTFMPTSGSILSFNQSIPFYADKKFISDSSKLKENQIKSWKNFSFDSKKISSTLDN